MLKRLQFLFLPNQSNNQKAQSLHLSSLMILLFIVVAFKNIVNVVERVNPGILGFATNVNTQGLLELTNRQRAEQGLGPLVTNSLLEEAARQKAAAMFSFGCWSHTCQDKSPWWFFQNVGYNYLYAGENLARDFAENPEVVLAWMESPTHRDNILNQKYTEIGFAVVDGVLLGEETTLVVQLFGTPGGTPVIASGDRQMAAAVEKETIMEPEILISGSKQRIQPLISSFTLTKSFSLGLIGFLILLFTLDAFLIYQKKVVRVSGKSFIHLSFFIIILLAILLSYQGQIL